MITALRWLKKGDKLTLQALGPARLGETDEDGYIRWHMDDMQWQDVPIVYDNVVQFEKAS